MVVKCRLNHAVQIVEFRGPVYVVAMHFYRLTAELLKEILHFLVILFIFDITCNETCFSCNVVFTAKPFHHSVRRSSNSFKLFLATTVAKMCAPESQGIQRI